MNSLDLSFFSLYRVGGQEWPLLPGLLAINPPRRTARGREQDRLIIYLTLAGNVPHSTTSYSEMTGRLAETFYGTPGSLTYALKSTVEALNTSLTEANMRTTGQGQYTMGALVLAALRGNLLYMVQSGPTHAFWLSSGGPRHLVDSALAGKGLGLSQTAKMYFSQAELREGDQVLFCAALPPNWEKSIMDERNPVAPDVLRRRLMILTPTNVSALLLQASSGTGQMLILKPVPEATAVEKPAAGVETKAIAADRNSTGDDAIPPVEAPAAQQAALPPVSVSAPVSAPGGSETASTPMEAGVTSSRPDGAARRRRDRRQGEYSPEPKLLITPARKQKLAQWGRGSAHFLAKTIHSGRTGWDTISQNGGKFIARLLPGEEDSSFSFSRAWLLFIALAIPILVVTIAAVVYFQFGKTAQYETYYSHAISTAMETLNVQDATQLRVKWQATLDWLDQAEYYQVTSDSQKLRKQAQQSLDSLDRILRINFKRAFTVPLSKTLRVTQMAASDTDVYLLNDGDGSVIRGMLSGNAYDVREFDCKPGTYNNIEVGTLVDIIALPRSNASGATLMGIDAAGNLLYCIPDDQPFAAQLATPSTGWGRVSSIAYDAGNLYVLDTGKNAVWVYFGQPGARFPDSPLFFFEEQIPPMADVISMAVNSDDLYLLHKDGHLTTCTLSRISSAPTRCIEPATLIDTRPGYQSGPTLSDGIFTQIVFTPAPDPAVSLLEPYTQSVFRFSPRQLELQNQLHAQPGKDNPLPVGQPITSMTFSPNKVVFIFVGGDLYFAVNTP